MGGEERMKSFPPLVSQDFTLKGLGYLQATADIKMSSAGDQTQPHTGTTECCCCFRKHAIASGHKLTVVKVSGRCGTTEC